MLHTSPSRKSKRLILLTGIGPGDSGTGQLMGFLADNIPQQMQKSTRVIVGFPRKGELRLALKQRKLKSVMSWVKQWANCTYEFSFHLGPALLDKNVDLILFHPQSLGFRMSLAILQWKRGTKKLFLLDNSFFCIRSYNFVPRSSKPCLQCLGGKFSSIKKNNCKAFPRGTFNSKACLKKLYQLVTSQKVHLLAQTKTQMALAKEHFGQSAKIQLAGMWTRDFESVVRQSDYNFSAQSIKSRPLFVLHSYYHPAKGCLWMIDLAATYQEADFIFPFTKPADIIDKLPPNVKFAPMTWHTGLEKLVREADAVFVPSLWSSPVEGALIKSILLNTKVYVLDQKFSYTAEIPEGVIYKLDADPSIAARQIRKTLHTEVDNFLRFDWLNKFNANRNAMLEGVFSENTSEIS